MVFTSYPFQDSIKGMRNHAGGAITPDSKSLPRHASVIFCDNHNAWESRVTLRVLHPSPETVHPAGTLVQPCRPERRLK